MIKLYEIPTNKQLLNIAKYINEELKDIKKNNMKIVFELDNNLLKQIDEEYFFKKNNEDTQFIPSDEVELIVSGIKFNFIKKENDTKEKEKKTF